MRYRHRVEGEFEWDESKGERNRIRRGFPFDLAMALFDGFVVEEPDTRRDHEEARLRAIGVAGHLTLQCVYTDRVGTRRIISLREANRRERNGFRAKNAR